MIRGVIISVVVRKGRPSSMVQGATSSSMTYIQERELSTQHPSVHQIVSNCMPDISGESQMIII